MKVLLQDICVAKYRWDDLLQDELLMGWQNILTDLHNCKNIFNANQEQYELRF